MERNMLFLCVEMKNITEKDFKRSKKKLIFGQSEGGSVYSSKFFPAKEEGVKNLVSIENEIL